MWLLYSITIYSPAILYKFCQIFNMYITIFDINQVFTWLQLSLVVNQDSIIVKVSSFLIGSTVYKTFRTKHDWSIVSDGISQYNLFCWEIFAAGTHKLKTISIFSDVESLISENTLNPNKHFTFWHPGHGF